MNDTYAARSSGRGRLTSRRRPNRNPTPWQKAADAIERACAVRPQLAFILGSGFRDVFANAVVEASLPYARLRGFPTVGVAGHEGSVLVARLGGVPLLVLNGRGHFYEGHSMETIAFPVRVLAELGVRHLVLTNAAGGIHRRFRAGDFMLLTDHINFMGANPLSGAVPAGRSRFVDLSAVYDSALNDLWRRAASRCGLTLREGTYLAVSGPSYETPAEIRAFGKLGADAVGMSTVPEAIVARQCGLAVAAISCITNLAAGRTRAPLSHQEVLEMGQRVRDQATSLMTAFTQLYGKARL